MKRIYKTLIVLIFVMSVFTIDIYAHGGNISGWKDKDSDKIVFFNGNYYGYHNENKVRHFHQVEWNEDKQRWDILKTAVYYDENFNIIKNNQTDTTEKIEVLFIKPVDGDTAEFELNGKTITARFLGINTRETVAPDVPVQKWGQEASDYTKNALQDAGKIEIEYDEKSQRTDRYDRDLVWVWVDDKLLQEQLVLKGLAEQYMLQTNYRYADIIQEAESIAKKDKIGIWSDTSINNLENIKNDELAENVDSNTSNDSQNDFIILIMTVVLGLVSVLSMKLKKS